MKLALVWFLTTKEKTFSFIIFFFDAKHLMPFFGWFHLIPFFDAIHLMPFFRMLSSDTFFRMLSLIPFFGCFHWYLFSDAFIWYLFSDAFIWYLLLVSLEGDVNRECYHHSSNSHSHKHTPWALQTWTKKGRQMKRKNRQKLGRTF